ncbi:tetratricopeptide repeat protein [Bacillus nakamurai]|uniref:Aspartate phosphatase n=1 Tax=Bacillus nakamurai TaxID=1793963 RepID=A0A150F2S6_9BACI|nr:tetratricopeptide repeat protein [Bacillus nakamurai]KXZ13178.1 aspartate phosphatase [Bacillus nakamurai]MED1227791.1 tetratricopeptide repeat protein [Bacillus nakamurai]
MIEVIAHEKVAKKISDWYEEIKKHKTESAKALREQLLTDLQNMTQHQTVLLYFNLIDSRYKLLMEEYEQTDDILKTIQLNADKEKTDQMIQYYYYFFSGMHEFYKKRFTKAINFYRIAESRLQHIPNEIERAEFNYQVAIAYYEIRQNYFAMNHAEKALEIYRANEMYAVREAQCLMVIGCNRMDLFHYQQAEKILQTAVHQASKAGDGHIEALAHFNLGICYERQEKLTEARVAFETALEKKEHRSSAYAVRSMYMLSRVLFKQEQTDEGRFWLYKALQAAEEKNESSYKQKLRILQHVFIDHNEEMLAAAFDELKHHELWSDVTDLTYQAAKHFKKQENYKLAAKYFQESIDANDQILRLTEGIRNENM